MKCSEQGIEFGHGELEVVEVLVQRAAEVGGNADPGVLAGGCWSAGITLRVSDRDEWQGVALDDP